MLELRATHGTRFDDPAHRPRMRPGEGITGVAAELAPPGDDRRAQAHLDPRFRAFPNLPEDEYESILAVPVLARDHLAGALNVRTRRPRAFSDDEVALLSAIAGQVGQAIENAKLYERSQRRVAELEALAEISRSMTSSLYLDDVLRDIAASTCRALRRAGVRRRARGRRRARRRLPRRGRPRRGRADRDRRAARRSRPRPPPPSRCAGSSAGSERWSSRATHPARGRRRSSRCFAPSPTRAPPPSRRPARRCAACSPRRSTTASRTTCRRWHRCCACSWARPASRRPRRRCARA